MLARLLLLACAFAALAAPAATAGPSPHMYDPLIRDLNALGIDNPNIRPFLASAEASEAAFLRGNCSAALGALGALDNKLDAQVGVDNPDFRAIRNDIADISAALVPPPDPEVPPGPC
jgi:hypothetical protein